MTITGRNALALLAIKLGFGALLALGFANIDIPAPVASAMDSAVAIDVTAAYAVGESGHAPAPADVCPITVGGEALR